LFRSLKEATVPCLHAARRDPWEVFVVAEYILMMRYQCLQIFISTLRRNRRKRWLGFFHHEGKGFQQVFRETKQPADKEKRLGEIGQRQSVPVSAVVTMKPSSCLDEANHLSTLTN
jgi:hypothetical protein